MPRIAQEEKAVHKSMDHQYIERIAFVGEVRDSGCVDVLSVGKPRILLRINHFSPRYLFHTD